MCTLLEKTKQLLAERPRYKTYALIASEIGVSEYWILNLVTGKMPEPSVVKVQKLYEYLSGHKLNV